MFAAYVAKILFRRLSFARWRLIGCSFVGDDSLLQFRQPVGMRFAEVRKETLRGNGWVQNALFFVLVLSIR
jgi:hypothetical protein